MATETERIKDGVHEHHHETHPFWHPVSRMHNGKLSAPINPCKTTWKVGDIEDVTEMVEVMHDTQLYYVDLCGASVDLPEHDALYATIPPGRPTDDGWAREVSKIKWMSATIQYRHGDVASTMLESRFGRVTFEGDYATFEEGSLLHDARLLIYLGLAEKYIPCPDLTDAMHILHVAGDESGEGRYYDLIRLPSGGHIPVGILESEYGVSWETLAKIPLGKPRDYETFTCPICGRRSYYSGICQECKCDADDQTIDDADDRRVARKEAEHGEILRLIKSGNWSSCRYMRG